MSRARRVLVRLAVAAALLAAGSLTGAYTLSRVDPDRAEDPASLAEEAALRLRAARSEGAAARAPLNLVHAEDAYAGALLERRRQSHRPAWLRDFRAARAALNESLLRADAAADIARRAARRDRTAATRGVAAGDAALALLAGREELIWLPDTVRHRLQRARTLQAEAHSLLDGGAFREAADRTLAAGVEAGAVTDAVHAATSRFTDEARIREWRSWANEAVAWSRRTGKTAVVVDKDAHVLYVYQQGRVVREYAAELGWNNVGDKRQQGDGATPEGRYIINELKGRGRSRYHKALHLDYPNAGDLAALAALKSAGVVPPTARPGGLIEIHGEGGRGRDWTDGCIALTNAQINWLFARVAVGTPVTIVGSLTGDGLFSQVARSLRR